MIEQLGAITESVIRQLPKSGLRNLALTLMGMPTAASSVHEEYGRADPRDFIRDVLGLKPNEVALSYGYKDPWTPDQERLMLSVRDHRKTAAPSGHGTGKTRDLAMIVLWWLYSFRPSKVITTAPTWTQVAKLLWAEIGALFAASAKPLPGKKNLLEITLEPDWFALGLTTAPRQGDLSATRFQGFHSPHLLVVVDEAVGVDRELKEGAEGMAIGPDDRIVAAGNPTNPSSWFKEACDSPQWNVVHLDSTQHPNVLHRDHRIIPGAVTYEWIQDRLEEYGSEESALYMSKVLGLWPAQASDALIHLGWIEQAQRRGLIIAEKKADGTFKSLRKGAALGLDVAGEGTDLTNAWLIDEDLASMPEVNGKRAWHTGRDVSHAVDLVMALMLEYPQIRVIVIDDTGLGQGVTAELRRKQRDGKLPRFDPNPNMDHPGRGRSLWIIPANFGASAWQPDRFADVKDELWWTTRESLRSSPLALPTDKQLEAYSLPKGNSLIRQLTTPIYGSDSSGKIVVWDKRSSRNGAPDEKTRERIQQLPDKSPDLAHALAMAIHGWKKLRPGTVAEAPKTQEELFDQQTRDLIDRATRAKDPKKPRLAEGKKPAPLAPYQRRGRR